MEKVKAEWRGGEERLLADIVATAVASVATAAWHAFVSVSRSKTVFTTSRAIPGALLEQSSLSPVAHSDTS